MGRVLEALQRQQENPDFNEDPLTETTGTPALSAEPELNGFELPERIGSPLGPRSNAGAAMSFFSEAELERVQDDYAAYEEAPQSFTPVAPPPVPEPAPVINKQSVPAPASGQPKVFTPPHTIEPPVPTTIPLEESRLHTRLVLFTDPQSIGCEQYRTLRTQLFHTAERQLTQVVLMTSAVAGEGKTSTILNLACAIAQSKEKRVLVIDSDLRRPSVSSYLGLDFELGFGEVLNNVSDPIPSIVRVADSTLYILSSTREEPNPAELLSRERVGETIAELRKYFDYILIDAPPVVAFADARLLANHADAVIMVVRAGMAGHSTIERAKEALPASRILGVVLNGADQMSEVGYYGYYGYGYGYGYRKQNEKMSMMERLGLGPLVERFKKKSSDVSDHTDK